MAQLTDKQFPLLGYLAQVEGADLFNYGDAIDGRALEKLGFIETVKAKSKLSGTQRLPYFGAFITSSGRDFLASSFTQRRFQ